MGSVLSLWNLSYTWDTQRDVRGCHTCALLFYSEGRAGETQGDRWLPQNIGKVKWKRRNSLHPIIVSSLKLTT